jgi:hypothetical protein
MHRILIACAIALVFQAAAAKPSAEPRQPQAEAVKHAGLICTDKGAFGRPFGRGYGYVDTTVDDDWTPFAKLTLGAGEITAIASFHGAGDSREDDEAAAKKFLKALDKAIQAKHHFPHREAHRTGAAFRSGKEPGKGLMFEVRQEDDQIIATCIEPGD